MLQAETHPSLRAVGSAPSFADGHAGEPRAATAPSRPGPDDQVYPAFSVAMILDSVMAEGVAAESALRGVGLTRRQLADPKTRVSASQVVACFRNAVALTGDDRFAYHAGLGRHVSSFGIFGFALLSSVDFRQTMRLAERHSAVAAPLVELAFVERRGSAVWSFSPIPHAGIDAATYRAIVEWQLGVAVTLHRDVMGPDFAPRELRVTYAAAGDAGAYAEAFGFPVRFRQPRNELVYDARWLDGTPPFGNALCHAAMLDSCEALLDELALAAGLIGRVRRLLLADPLHPTSLQHLARSLGMSSRTLRRRLEDEHTSYRELLDDLRRNTAIKYLRDTDMSVEEVADALGFSNAANFRHAFRRWTSAAPREFRSLHRPCRNAA